MLSMRVQHAHDCVPLARFYHRYPSQVEPSPKPEKKRSAVTDMCCNCMYEILVDDLLFQYNDDDDNDSFTTRDTRNVNTRATNDETTTYVLEAIMMETRMLQVLLVVPRTTVMQDAAGVRQQAVAP